MRLTPEQKRLFVEWLRCPRTLRKPPTRERYAKEVAGVSRKTLRKCEYSPEIQALLKPDVEPLPSPADIKEYGKDLGGRAIRRIIALADRDVEWALKHLAKGFGESPFACPRGYEPRTCPLMEMQGDLHTLPKGLVSDLFVQFLAEVLQEIKLPPSERRTLKEWLTEHATNHIARSILEEVFDEEPET